MTNINNPLFGSSSGKPFGDDENETGEDFTDYQEFADKFAQTTGEALTVDDSRPAPLPKAPEYDPDEPGEYIKYTGYATLRIITPSAWKQVGVHDMGRKEWNHLNKYKVPKSEFSQHAIRYLLEQDGSFELVTQ